MIVSTHIHVATPFRVWPHGNETFYIGSVLGWPIIWRFRKVWFQSNIVSCYYIDIDSSLYAFSDELTKPSAAQNKWYNRYHSSHDTPIVIDNGSWQCRAGWAGEDAPRLAFRNIIAKIRGKKVRCSHVTVMWCAFDERVRLTAHWWAMIYLTWSYSTLH